ncbi:hypothetical protein GCM10009116_23000 [Brevundimonas basaltis]
MASTDAWACREGARAYPSEIAAENSRLIATADRIVIGRLTSPRRDGLRVRADIEPERIVRGTGRSIAFEDQSLPSTCSPLASRRLGSLVEGMSILILEKDGPDGFSILIDEGGLLMLEANDLLALIEPDTGE